MKPNKPFSIAPQIRLSLLTLVAVFSIGWTIYDWARLDELKSRVEGIAYLGVSLMLSEAFFIVGAILMLLAIGEELPTLHFTKWLHHLRFVKREIKTIASSAIQSRLFGIGFWMNFTGAVLTSLILVFGVVKLLPIQAWGILLILAIDLIATFGWRIPLHISRKRLKDE